MRDQKFQKYLLAGVASLCIAMPAYAQDNNTAVDEDEVIATGTRVDRTGFETPLAATTLGDDFLRTFAGSGSQADILQQVPGLKAEGGGGEVATNLFVRGLPTPGQLQFTPLNYDGIPVLSNSGLNSSAVDFFARNDLGIERLEFVKGGVANLFGVSSTVGVLNYISKTGTEENHGTLQLEVAGDNRYRGDFAFQGPVNDDTFYAVSGFYRYDEGPIVTGQPSEGFALRGNLEHQFTDGSGLFRIHGTYINDRVNFYLPLPLDGTTRERIAGNDGEEVFSTNLSQINGVSVPTPEGFTTYTSDDGFSAKGGSLAAIVEKELGNDWAFDARIKYSNYDSTSDFYNGSVGLNVPLTQQQYIDDVIATTAGVTAAQLADVVFTDADTGVALGANDRVLQNGFNNRDRPTSDGTLELNITKSVEAGDVTHNFTLGGFVGRAESVEDTRGVRFLQSWNAEPRLINVTVGGQDYAAGGIVQPLSWYTIRDRTALSKAVYFADQIEGSRWSFDIGGRLEEQTISNRVAIAESIPSTLSDNPLPGSPVSVQQFGTGQFNDGEATATAWALAAGGLYEINDNLNVYANASRGYFFPQAQGTNGQISSAAGDIAVFDEEPVVQAELGFKYRTGNFKGSIAGFYVGLRDRNAVSFTGDNLTPTITATDTDAIGIELDAQYDVSDFLTLTGNLTLQDAKFVGDSQGGGTSIVDNEVNRQPSIYGNIGALVNYGAFDASAFYNYQGDTFQDPGNGTPLDAYGHVRGEVGYTFGVSDTSDETIRLSLGVWNLFDSQGLAEGNPRAGVIQTPGANAEFFSGRPILPRRVTARVTYDF